MAGTKPKTKTPAAAGYGKKKGDGKRRPSALGGGGRLETRRHGPRLPAALRRELDALASNPSRVSDEEAASGSDRGGEDLYEYEEGVPEEEAGKNGRYDAVEKYEYEYDSDDPAADDDVPSEEGEDLDDDEGEEEDEEKQLRILQETTGMPREAFDGEKKNRPVELPVLPGDDGGRPVTVHDLLDNLQGKAGYSNLRKRLQQQEKKTSVVQAPLPKVERERLERGVVYQQSKKDVTKWESQVKRNREAPTLYFENDVNLGVNSVGAIASEFKPRTEFEKKMAEIVHSTEMVEAHKNDGAKILELNKIDVEDVRERQHRLAKIRTLLFRHEMKAKRVKKIKSRTYHRMLKKDRLKAASADLEANPEAAKEYAMRQEFKRAEERMTLKHKNNSKWAKRILERGLAVQDEGTRAAITAQLQKHALLTRKMNSINENSSSSEESTDDDEEDEEDNCLRAKFLNRAKEKTLKALEDDNEIPRSGVFSLPFMERGLKKREEAAYEEARLALQEYDESLRKLEDENTEEDQEPMKLKGKRTFGPAKNVHQETNKRSKVDDVGKNSDSEYDSESAQHVDNHPEVNKKAEDVQLGTALLDDEPQNAVFKSFNDIVKDPGPKTTFEVSILANNSWKKVKSSKGNDNSNGNANKSVVQVPSTVAPNHKQMDHTSDSDSDEEMVEGFLTTSDIKARYELPSQANLVRQAFAADDVEAEFEKDKMEVLNEENPEAEKPDLIPGWGQWTHIQQKKGVPSWMVEEHENAKKKREEALKRRKDAKLKHVIISEHVDKKAEKLLAKNLPFPYTSKDVYEQSIRMPIGPDFNPAISVSALNRPAIVKKPGVIIKPIQYEEVNPHEKPDELKRVIQRVAPNPKAKKPAGKQTKVRAAHNRK